MDENDLEAGHAEFAVSETAERAATGEEIDAAAAAMARLDKADYFEPATSMAWRTTASPRRPRSPPRCR